MAAENGHTEIVKVLLDKGADVEEVVTVALLLDEVPVAYANEVGHTETVKVLLRDEVPVAYVNKVDDVSIHMKRYIVVSKE